MLHGDWPAGIPLELEESLKNDNVYEENYLVSRLFDNFLCHIVDCPLLLPFYLLIPVFSWFVLLLEGGMAISFYYQCIWTYTYMQLIYCYSLSNNLSILTIFLIYSNKIDWYCICIFRRLTWISKQIWMLWSRPLFCMSNHVQPFFPPFLPIELLNFGSYSNYLSLPIIVVLSGKK